MPRHDVAIYMPYASGFYDRARGRAGGAERQTVLLARSLVAQGLRVAHIVYPMRDPPPGPGEPTFVVRRPERYKPLGRATDTPRIWRALARADAAAYVFRGASGVLGPAAAFCAARGRALVFSGANNSDFRIPPTGMEGARSAMYVRGVDSAAAIVVQSADQVALARGIFTHPRIAEIPSFVEAGAPAAGAPGFFLWAARLVDYKRPLEFVELARAVPEARFRMVGAWSIGDTADGFVAELQRQAAELDNLELLPAVSHAELMAMLEETVAVVNTSTTEGMPNVWLEGWARGIPALSLEFDPDGRVARDGLGVAAAGDRDAFRAGARALWPGRADRGGYGDAVRHYVSSTHGAAAVGAEWARLLREVS